MVAPPQHQPQPQPQRAPTAVIYPDIVYPAPVDYGHEDIRRCRADNQRAHVEVVDYYERARAAGRISPAEARQFSEMEARLRNFRTQLAWDGLTLQDCQRLGSAIARERDKVARMTRRDPNVARCMADNRRAHQAVYDTYNNAVRAGRIDAGEA